MGKPVKREPKEPYSRLLLTVHGTVRELAQLIATNGHRDKASW